MNGKIPQIAAAHRRKISPFLFSALLLTVYGSRLTATAAPLDPRTEGLRFFPTSVAFPEVSQPMEINPAGIGVLPGQNLYGYYNRQPGKVDRFGLSYGGRPFALSWQWLDAPEGDIPDMHKGSVGLGLGRGPFFLGAALHFLGGGDAGALDSVMTLDAGSLLRFRRFSIGVAAYDLNEPPGREIDDLAVPPGQVFSVRPGATGRLFRGVRTGIGVRPFSGLTTFSADIHAFPLRRGGQRDTDLFYNFGWDQSVGRGVHLTGAYRTDFDRRREILFGLTLKMRHLRMGYQALYEREAHSASSESAWAPALVGLHFHSTAHEDAVRPPRVAAEVHIPRELPERKTPAFPFLEGPHLLDFLDQLRRLRESEDVHTVLFRVPPLDMDFAKIQELRGALEDLRMSGKFLIAYIEDPNLAEFYLATAADRIVLYPQGHVEIAGLRIEMLFLRGTLDLLGIEPQFVQAGEYKGTPETFMRKDATPAHRENVDALLGDLFEQVVEAIALGRGLDPKTVEALVDRGLFAPREAVEARLVDQLGTWEDAQAVARAQAGRGSLHWDHQRTARERETDEAWTPPRHVAAVYIGGAILPGQEGPLPFFGSRATYADTLVQTLKEIEKDRRIRAVVLRVNSPGGDVLASDLIWQAVKRLAAAKPVVVSMGGTAASGAYFVSTGSETLFADPATVTGSIGVYYGKFVLKGLFGKIGLSKEIVQRGRHAHLRSDYSLLDAEELALVQKGVDYWYGVFLDRVTGGRKMAREDAERVAGGRVWTGRQAQRQGLLDHLGGLEDALAAARVKAGIRPGDPVEVHEYPKPRPLRGLLRRLLATEDLWGSFEWPDLGPYYYLMQPPLIAAP